MIVLDTLNTRFEDQARVRRDMLKFVDETLQPDEPVALLTIGPGGLNVINDFTTDPHVLAAAVKKVRGLPTNTMIGDNTTEDIESLLLVQRQSGRAAITMDAIGNELQAFEEGTLDTSQALPPLIAALSAGQQAAQMNGVAETLHALRQIAESFSGVPGRKSLIWATGGLPFVADDPQMFSFRGGELMRLYESTWNALNESQITVYPLDVGGLFNNGFVSPRFRRSRQYSHMTDTVSNLETLAKMTGGKLCEYKMSMSGCFDEAQKDANQYYLIGYYADTAKGKSGWRKLDVRVEKANMTVRARTRYYVREKPPDPVKQEREDMDTAIVSPTDFTAVPMLVRWTTRKPDGEKTQLGFKFNVAGPGITIDGERNNMVSLAFGAFVKTTKGGIAGDFVKELEGSLPAATAEQVAAHGVNYEGTISVPPGKYVVRFVVRDNLSGRLGTVSVPTEVLEPAIKSR
jgi:VWFA-related protein